MTLHSSTKDLMWEAHNINMGRNCCPSELGCLEQVFHGVPLPDSMFNQFLYVVAGVGGGIGQAFIKIGYQVLF